MGTKILKGLLKILKSMTPEEYAKAVGLPIKPNKSEDPLAGIEIYGIVYKRHKSPVAVGLSLLDAWRSAEHCLGDKVKNLLKMGYRCVAFEKVVLKKRCVINIPRVDCL